MLILGTSVQASKLWAVSHPSWGYMNNYYVARPSYNHGYGWSNDDYYWGRQQALIGNNYAPYRYYGSPSWGQSGGYWSYISK